VKEIRDVISNENNLEDAVDHAKDAESMTKKELEAAIAQKTKKMNQAAAELNFELAAVLRDECKELKILLRDFED
jgi:excinuclease ABC subunit B